MTVGLTPTVCNLFGLDLIAATREKYPQLQVNIVSGYSGYVHEWLVDGRLDMAVLHDARRSSTITVDPLAAAELFLILPAASTNFDFSKAASLAEIAAIPLVLPTRNHGLRRTLEYAASDAGESLTVAFEVDTLELLKKMVVSGMAGTILAKPAVLDELVAGTLIARKIAAPGLQTKLMLATAVRRPITRGIRLVEQQIKGLVDSMIEERSDQLGLVHIASMEEAPMPTDI